LSLLGGLFYKKQESVGKSSLISTFVSRYFSEHGVPGIMTRVRLPPDPHSLCITTIVDSQAGDVALLQQYHYQQQQQRQRQSFSDDTRTACDEPSVSLLPPPESETTTTTLSSSSLIVDVVDSIVLVYDLDRVDTFTRLENHWLPLIEQCYQGKVRQS
jgi:mitochondrial Rho GTPase 1